MTSTTSPASSLPPPFATGTTAEDTSSSKQQVENTSETQVRQNGYQQHQRFGGGGYQHHHQHRSGNNHHHHRSQHHYNNNNNTHQGSSTTSKTTSPEDEEPHINFCYKELDHVKFERFPACVSETNDATKILRVAPPNETHPFQEIPAEYCLKTKAFTGGKRITSHCAHYYYNRICNRGSGCFFIHAISFEVPRAQQEEQERLHQHKKMLSQQQQQYRHNHSSPFQGEDANIYYSPETGYSRRTWGRTRNFYDDQGEIDPDASTLNSTAPTAALPIFSAPPPKTNTVKVVPDEEDRTSDSDLSNHSSSSTSAPPTTAGLPGASNSITSSRAQSGLFAAFSRNGNDNVTSPPSTPQHGPRSSGAAPLPCAVPKSQQQQQKVSAPLPSSLTSTPNRHGYGYTQHQQPASLPSSVFESPNQLNEYYNHNTNGNSINISATNSPSNKKHTPSRRCVHNPYSWTETTKLISS